MKTATRLNYLLHNAIDNSSLAAGMYSVAGLPMVIMLWPFHRSLSIRNSLYVEFLLSSGKGHDVQCFFIARTSPRRYQFGSKRELQMRIAIAVSIQYQLFQSDIFILISADEFGRYQYNDCRSSGTRATRFHGRWVSTVDVEHFRSNFIPIGILFCLVQDFSRVDKQHPLLNDSTFNVTSATYHDRSSSFAAHASMTSSSIKDSPAAAAQKSLSGRFQELLKYLTLVFEFDWPLSLVSFKF